MVADVNDEIKQGRQHTPDPVLNTNSLSFSFLFGVAYFIYRILASRCWPAAIGSPLVSSYRRDGREYRTR